MKYMAKINGLRALELLPLILFHACFELFSGGFIGKDVLFVIGSYLILKKIIMSKFDGYSLVPLGEALNFSYLWDGVCLILHMTRKISVRI